MESACRCVVASAGKCVHGIVSADQQGGWSGGKGGAVGGRPTSCDVRGMGSYPTPHAAGTTGRCGKIAQQAQPVAQHESGAWPCSCRSLDEPRVRPDSRPADSPAYSFGQQASSIEASSAGVRSADIRSVGIEWPTKTPWLPRRSPSAACMRGQVRAIIEPAANAANRRIEVIWIQRPFGICFVFAPECAAI